MCDWAFALDGPFPEADGWWFVVRGRSARRHGPFADRDAAQAGTEALLARWVRRARASGGWAWRRAACRWVVTLPEGQPCDGIPFRDAVVSRVPDGAP